MAEPGRGRRRRGDAGAASTVLLVGVVPSLVVVTSLCVDVGSLAYDWARVDHAARAGAAAADAGGRDRGVVAAVRAELPRGLLGGLRVDVGEDAVVVSVPASSPLLLGRAVDRLVVTAPREATP